MKYVWKVSALISVAFFLAIFFREEYPSRIKNRIFSSNPLFSVSYNHKVTLFQKFNCENKIVFLGDSLTEKCEWNELFERNDIVNRGITGDTTYRVLNRLDSCLSQKPKSVFLMLGVNEIRTGILDMDNTKNNYSRIIEKILEYNVPLFIQSTLYTNNPRRNKGIDILNKHLIDHCKLLSVQYIDINGSLAENKLLLPKYSYDGIHLNGDGYVAWKQVIIPYISQIAQ